MSGPRLTVDLVHPLLASGVMVVDVKLDRLRPTRDRASPGGQPTTDVQPGNGPEPPHPAIVETDAPTTAAAAYCVSASSARP
jgi:hypothetical protein